MDMHVLLLISTAVVGIGLVVYLIVGVQAHTRRVILERLRAIQEEREMPIERYTAAERELLPTVGRVIAGASFTQKLMDEIARAGWRLKPSEYVGIVIASVGVGVIVFTIITQSVPMGLVGGLIGYAIPRTVLKLAVGRRKAALELQITDMVMLISSALRSGYSFMRAMQVVAREMPPPISEACKRVVDETQLGVPMEDALTRMAEKTGSYDMGLVATAVVIQSQVGGSLAEVLDAIGETIRQRVEIHGEVSALTAEGRISGIVLMLLTPAMAIALMVINPKYISVLISDPMGTKLIVLAVVLQIVGFLWIKRMMKLDI